MSLCITTLLIRDEEGNLDIKKYNNSGLNMKNQISVLKIKKLRNIIKKYYDPGEYENVDFHNYFLEDEIEFSDIEEIYKSRNTGEMFLAPTKNGIQFFDFKDKKIWDLNFLKEKIFDFNICSLKNELENFLEKYKNINITDIKRSSQLKKIIDSENIINFYFRNLFFFWQSCEKYNILYSGKIFDLKRYNFSEIKDFIFSIKNTEFSTIKILSDWKIIGLDNFQSDKEAFISLNSYLKEENLLSKNDSHCWKIFFNDFENK